MAYACLILLKLNVMNAVQHNLSHKTRKACVFGCFCLCVFLNCAVAFAADATQKNQPPPQIYVTAPPINLRDPNWKPPVPTVPATDANANYIAEPSQNPDAQAAPTDAYERALRDARLHAAREKQAKRQKAGSLPSPFPPGMGYD